MVVNKEPCENFILLPRRVCFIYCWWIIFIKCLAKRFNFSCNIIGTYHLCNSAFITSESVQSFDLWIPWYICAVRYSIMSDKKFLKIEIVCLKIEFRTVFYFFHLLSSSYKLLKINWSLNSLFLKIKDSITVSSVESISSVHQRKE